MSDNVTDEDKPSKTPTDEQRRRASFLQAMIEAALTDGDHPAWDSIIDPAWNVGMRIRSGGDRITACLNCIDRAVAVGQKNDLSAEVVARSILHELSWYDRAFEAVDTDAAARAVGPMLRGESRGAVNVLARLTRPSGALGCPDEDRSVEQESSRLNQARHSRERKVKS